MFCVLLVRSYGFVRISWRLLLYRVITRERRVKKGCQGRDWVVVVVNMDQLSVTAEFCLGWL
jgi:hypothetical protein